MIEFKNISFTYCVSDAEGNQLLRTGIKKLDLTIHRGEFVVLTGSSGCGKTTLCRLINGLIPHYFAGELSGEVLIDGINIAKQPIYETSCQVGSVFQNPRSQFFNVDTTSELAFAAENQGRNPDTIRTDIAAVSQRMGLEPLLGRSMFHLSGGEKQRIACGTVAVADPPIMVLDEPSSNLDMDGIEQLQQILALWKQQGKTVIIAEHRLFFLRELADRVLLFEDGCITKELSGRAFASLSPETTAAMGIRAVDLDVLQQEQQATASGEQIVLKDISYSYPDKQHGVQIPSLKLPKGQIVAIVGHNGAGKSTLARTLCGLNKKAKGTVCLDGKTIPVSKMLQHCYMIMQDVNHQLFTESVLEEVLLSVPEAIPEGERVQIAENSLHRLDIEAFANMHPMALSGGQKQRVAIASAIAADKQIILMDEPTSGLDYLHMMQVAEVLQMLKENGKTLLVITHDLELIACCADHILHLEKGTVRGSYPVDNGSFRKLQTFLRKQRN